MRYTGYLVIASLPYRHVTFKGSLYQALEIRWHDFKSWPGAYAKLLEESGFEYHVLSPVWTEEQTAAIYAVDQFESFSSPYTQEANMSHSRESSLLLLISSEVYHISFLQITEQNQWPVLHREIWASVSSFVCGLCRFFKNRSHPRCSSTQRLLPVQWWRSLSFQPAFQLALRGCHSSLTCTWPEDVLITLTSLLLSCIYMHTRIIQTE